MIYNKSLANHYNEYHGRTPQLFNLQLSKINTYLDLNSTSNVLDAGSGAGRLLIPISKYVKKIVGVELSEFMLNSMSSIPANAIIYNENYVSWLNKQNRIPEAVYFSYTLHQMSEHASEQIKILNDTFDKGAQRILLITISHSQLDDNVINQLCPKIVDYDKSRFINRAQLSKHFNIELYEEETNILLCPKEEIINKVQNKYISSLQILADEELEKLVTDISKLSSPIIYPDFYTYILLTRNEK